MEKEPYKPSEEEMQAAENTMTESEIKMTGAREQSALSLEAMGKRGYVYRTEARKAIPEYNSNEHTSSIEGKINGYKIEITRVVEMSESRNDTTSDTITGTVDGLIISDKDARALFKKYIVVAIDKNLEQAREKESIKERGEYMGTRDEGSIVKELLS